MLNHDTLVIIPTLNEKVAIRKTIEDVIRWGDCQIVVIDNLSDDGTADIAIKAGANVINVPRCGKGFAVRTALPQILDKYESKYIIMIDGDYTYPARHIPKAIRILGNGADIVIGYRAKREKDAISKTNIVGNYGLSLLASILYRKRIKDVCTGFWGFKKEVLEKFIITSDRFTLEADLFINAVRNKCKIVQIPISYRARLNGSDAHIRVKDGLEIAYFLFSELLGEYEPPA